MLYEKYSNPEQMSNCINDSANDIFKNITKSPQNVEGNLYSIYLPTPFLRSASMNNNLTLLEIFNCCSLIKMHLTYVFTVLLTLSPYRRPHPPL